MFALSRRRWTWLAVAGAAAAVAVAVVVAAVAGGWPYRALGNADPGLLVRLGTPVLRLAVDGAATVTVGALAFVVFFTGPQPSGGVSPAAYAGLRTAGRWATGWCLSALVLLPFDAAATSGLPLHRVLPPADLWGLFGVLEGPTAWLLTVLLTAGVAVGCRWVLRWRPVAVLLTVALLAVLPPLATGHSSSDAGHDLATAAIFLHAPAAVLWLGVLVALGRARGRVVDPEAVARRYRRLATCCWLVLAYSGIVDALVLAPPGARATTGFGLLVAVKVVALGLVGVLGVWARRRALRAADPRRPAVLARLVSTELVVLALTFGASAALTVLPPPAFLYRAVTGEETLLGYNLTAAPTVARLVLDWRVEVLFAPLCAVLAAGYLAGVRRLRRAGQPWPASRTAAWLAGCVVLLVATSAGVGRYAPAMFSLQTAVHMVIGMLVPALFALGGPLTLAEQALPAAPEGGLPGPREWLAALRSSTLLRVLTQPLVAVTVFVGAPFLLYFTEAFELTVRYHWAHLAMDAVFLVIGYLFAWPVIGVDPAPRPLPNLLRLGLLLAAMPFDIVFAAAVINSHRILGDGRASANLYSALDLPWVHSLSADQRLGGYLGLAIGELVFLLTLAILMVRWNRAEADDREAARRGLDDLLAARAGAAPASAVETAQPQAVGHHQQGGQGHRGTGDQRVE